ncbi:unnamed protein product [Staurois parvus]|uniref:Secreted protein n=1 Tax=Staurois parvus TaxID=386267 RepID=A0ABN9A7I6_9NEOB|nr:unnamed protein product [Staurois parvus]
MGLPLLLPPPPPCAMWPLSSAHAADGFRFLNRGLVFGFRTLLHPPPPCAMCLCRLLTLLTASAF